MEKRAGRILIACLILVFASITIAAAATAPGEPKPFIGKKPDREKSLPEKKITSPTAPTAPDLMAEGVKAHPIVGGYQISAAYYISECMTGPFWITVKINGVVFAESEILLANMPYIARTCDDHEGGLYYISAGYRSPGVFQPSSPTVIELKLDSKNQIIEANELNNTATWTMQ